MYLFIQHASTADLIGNVVHVSGITVETALTSTVRLSLDLDRSCIRQSYEVWDMGFEL